MTTENNPQRSLTSNELALERTDLATGRTMMAADRSLMAWVRTGLSMISFGFTIYKLLENLHKQSTIAMEARSPLAVGLFLTGFGTIAIVMGTVEYWHRTREISLIAGAPIKVMRPSFAMALMMSFIGVILFSGIIARVL